MNIGNRPKNEVIGLLVYHESEEHLPEHQRIYGRVTGQYGNPHMPLWCNVIWTFHDEKTESYDFPQSHLIEAEPLGLPTVEELLG